jgi:mercuric ion transport protein
MTDNIRTDFSDLKPPSVTGPTFLAASGLASAFGAASCCALPVLLGSVGLGSAWLGGLALLAAPYRPMLLAAAVVCLSSGSGLLLRRRRVAIACAPGAACRRSVATGLIMAVLCVGAALTALGFVLG